MDSSVIESYFLLAASKSFWANPASWWAIAQVILGLGAVIFVHELGHFLVAKACGVKCEKFYVGFDAFDIKIGDRVIVPRSLVKYQWGETEYGIGILPLGGYVKMLGQDDNPGNIEKEIQRSLNEGEDAQAAYEESGLVDRTKIDPRSFLAKSVPQRMAIISAGVIFNLIFAVLFAGWAFKTGVDYEPPLFGNVIGGGPAWKHDLTGASLVSINDKKVDGYFTYMDMAQEIVFNGDESPLELGYIPYGETEPKVVSITPQRGLKREAKDFALLGVSPRMEPKIGVGGALQGNTAALADPPILPGDTVIQINQTKIKTDIDLRRTLASTADQSVEMVLERSVEGKDGTTERIRTMIAPNPMRRVGFSVQWLPLRVIKLGSPAEKAGLKVGDEILSIDGKPRGDLLTLDQRMIRVAREGGTVKLEIKREGKTQTISISPIVPKMIADLGPNQPIAIDSLGVAIPMTRVIEEVEPGSPAAKAGVEQGDELLAVTYLLSDSQKATNNFSYLDKHPRVNMAKKGDETTWAEIALPLQIMEAGTEIELEVKRAGKDQTEKIKLKTVASDEFFLPTRGINLTLLQAHYRSASWSDALSNGYRQVVRDVKRVGTTLVTLIRGKISPKNLGGPGTIAMAATSEATRGTSRLLLFLTFLSANLAIINFLPIPILDGGHMVFLAYEGIFRKPASEKVQVALTYVGLAMILGLMLFVVFLDVERIIGFF